MAILRNNLIDGDYDITRKTAVAVAAKKAGGTAKVKGSSTVRKPKPAPKRTSKPAPKSSSSGRISTAIAAASGGSSGVKTSSDKAQIAALQDMISNQFGRARDQKLANVQKVYRQQDDDLVRSYAERIGSLNKSRADNAKAQSDSSFSNLANRAREARELIAQTASQGAGESDTLQSQLMALRNWSANQADVDRSYFDTVRSVNSSQTDLTASTRNSRLNLAADMLGDYEQIWNNYYNQRTDAYTQIGNIRANPYSDSYQKNAKDYAAAAKEAGNAWKNPGINKSLQDWKGTPTPAEKSLNNSMVANAATVPKIKKPEGSTLRKW